VEGGSPQKMIFTNNDVKIHLRPATAQDCELVFKWRNIPEIIALGSTQKPVSALEHSDWYGLILRSETSRLYIIQYGNLSIGQVRFESKDNTYAEISIFLLPSFTGRGLGVKAIINSCGLAFAFLPEGACIVAYVRKNNVCSLRAFEKAGFMTDNSGEQRVEHLRLVLTP